LMAQNGDFPTFQSNMCDKTLQHDSSPSNAAGEEHIDVTVSDLTGNTIAQLRRRFSAKVSDVKHELQTHHQFHNSSVALVSEGQLLSDSVELQEIGKVGQPIALQLVVYPAVFLAQGNHMVIDSNKRAVEGGDSHETNVFLEQPFSSGLHTICFRVVQAGRQGFAVGIADEKGKLLLTEEDDRQLGSRQGSWGWAAYKGHKSAIDDQGGWESFSEAWEDPGTEITLVLDCGSGSLSVAIGSGLEQLAFSHSAWVSVPLYVGWHLRGSRIELL